MAREDPSENQQAEPAPAFGTLYTYLPNARVLKILAAARLNSLVLSLPQPPAFIFGHTNHTPSFLSRFPLGKVPALALPTGEHIFESDAIALYIASSGPASTQLVGGDALQHAQIRQWICFAEGELMAHVLPLVLWRVGMAEFDGEREAAAWGALQRSLRVLEEWMRGRMWLATEAQLSLADLTVAGSLFWAFMHVIDEEIRETCPSLTEWYLRLVESPGVKEVFADYVMIQTRKKRDVAI